MPNFRFIVYFFLVDFGGWRGLILFDLVVLVFTGVKQQILRLKFDNNILGKGIANHGLIDFCH